MRSVAENIVREAIEQNLPGPAVRSALKGLRQPRGRLVLVAIGKAAWAMARAASDLLGDSLDEGIVITKYGHVEGAIERVVCREAGHPVVDAASVAATREAEELVRELGADDTVLFLVSGGGSALFEDPAIPLAELSSITHQLLACGASIEEINTVRKHLSRVKGGRFGELCAPAQVVVVALSDVLGDRLDTIASGPAYPDASTSAEALDVVRQYDLTLSAEALAALREETPKELSNAEMHVTGSVRALVSSAAEACVARGYKTVVLTSSLDCEAREAGAFLGAIARDHAADGCKMAFVVGGETVVHLRGDGLGGRNQELALAAAPAIAGLSNVCVVSVGSDGTDGPTDAAGGYVDGFTVEALAKQGISVTDALDRSDSYHALATCNGLVKTGPTGTNVNDVAVVLVGQ
ncbi:MAG: DUF4147 domain-containing protein [Atopobiaceae bacterium]|nr:DUF4147 domain-containing protein [Atopobiaceae bacterium]